MKFRESFDVKLTPFIDVREPAFDDNGEPLLDDNGDQMLKMGGRIDWSLYRKEGVSDGEHMAFVELLRIFSLQNTILLLKNKAYVNEYVNEPKFDISKEEMETVMSVIDRILPDLYQRLYETEGDFIKKEKKLTNFDF